MAFEATATARRRLAEAKPAAKPEVRRFTVCQGGLRSTLFELPARRWRRRESPRHFRRSDDGTPSRSKQGISLMPDGRFADDGVMKATPRCSGNLHVLR